MDAPQRAKERGIPGMMGCGHYWLKHSFRPLDVSRSSHRLLDRRCFHDSSQRLQPILERPEARKPSSNLRDVAHIDP
jgi:hypothetical protein